ncbi:replication-relaxation family protein [Bacillus testis]|uniref:replication-relaxation family protein n=1 Tax=Bacillus testis TaxID=1622072 RepID=UPI00067E6C15|nr:replication-relaxation family protein [Bacillus testis]
MKKRDQDILNDLLRFRCLTRDQLISLHFSQLNNPITSCNTVLKRLRRDGQIDVATHTQPYIYFPIPSIKKDSAKIPHFLSIAQFYIDIQHTGEIKNFIVEPKYGKDFMEPDVFMIYRKAPFFVEIQRSVYSKKVMDAKFKRYFHYYMSKEWENEAWQPKDRKVFPRILLITTTRYELPAFSGIKILQIQDSAQFISFNSQPVQVHKDIQINASGIKLVGN